ncbi:hypothetical protein [Nannocystis punicea]|uniref:Myxococcus cysteine-rich repeat-containing protein n=1 Tax=Nannocystis punicea TaxID=2995304 RepID=A0ABY7HAD4_9BACT|nr:hypothetical protein [Nannocystis poenicansa]WAS96062.1 hypothetical protein O0S08_07845 [Nannocystis poenicansa]
MLRSPRRSALPVLVLTACTPSIIVGDTPQDTDDATTSSPATSDSPESTGDLPTTTAGPGACGDGQQDPGEACDDGNDEPNDGCDDACGRSGQVEWTVEPEDVETVYDLAVGSLGQIVLNVRAGDQDFLLGLSPDGVEQWREPVEDMGEVHLHPDGRIFFGSRAGVLHCYSQDVTELWTFELAPTDKFFGIVTADDALYSGANGHFDALPNMRAVARKHRLDTGAPLWEAQVPHDGLNLGEELVLFGDRLVVVGRAEAESEDRSLLAVVDRTGAWLSTEQGGVPASEARAASIGADDLLLARFGADAGGLQRRGPDLGQLWSVVDTGPVTITNVAVGTDERIVLTGFDETDNHSSVVRLYDGSGVLQWTSVFASPNPDLHDLAYAAAFGPDFLVVAGHVVDGFVEETHGRMWVRRFLLD